MLALLPADFAGAETPEGEPAIRVLFDPADADRLTNQAQADLSAFAQELHREAATRMQIVAYAGPKQVSRARRLSLSRALAVREYLIGLGIASTRMNVRALGNTNPDGPADRVDIFRIAQ